MNLIKNLILTIFLMINVGCVEQPPKERIVYLPVPLTLPFKQEVPKIKGSDLQCLSSETKDMLLERDKVIKTYIINLESIILATQKERTK